MKITLVGPVYPYRGGIAHYTTILAQKMIQSGYEVEVISFHRQYPAWLYPGKTDRDPSHRPFSVPARYLLDSINPITWLLAANAIAHRRPDLVLIMWWSTFWAPADWVLARLLRLRGMHVAYLIHNVLPHEARFYDRWLSLLGLGAARDFLVQTQQQRDQLYALLPKARVIETTHPVYDMFSLDRLDRTEARGRLGIAQEADAVVLFFGIVRAYKGLGYLLEAVHLLKQCGKNVHLLVAGEFWESEVDYREQIRNAGIEDVVHIFNRYIENEDVPLFFSAADIFVAPYIGGTQSGAVNIALSFGLPIVMTEPIAESVQSDFRSACSVVAPGDPAALADSIKTQMTVRTATSDAAVCSEKTWLQLIAAIEELRKE